MKHFTRDSIVQNEGNTASNKHGSSEEHVQHLVDLNYAWERQRDTNWLKYVLVCTGAGTEKLKIN